MTDKKDDSQIPDNVTSIFKMSKHEIYKGLSESARQDDSFFGKGKEQDRKEWKKKSAEVQKEMWGEAKINPTIVHRKYIVGALDLNDPNALPRNVHWADTIIAKENLDKDKTVLVFLYTNFRATEPAVPLSALLENAYEGLDENKIIFISAKREKDRVEISLYTDEDVDMSKLEDV